MGEGESATTERPFHIMKAVERTRAKLSNCAAACRGFCRKENMTKKGGSRCGEERRGREAQTVAHGGTGN